MKYMKEPENLISEPTSLSEDLSLIVEHADASLGQRFLNWLIDNLLMRYGLIYITGTAVGFLLGLLAPEYILRVANDMTSFDLLFIGYIVAIFNYIVYYTICESAFRGYTLGKLITGTRAIREDGNDLTFKDALLRSLSRLVPFEMFSALGRAPWHDTWTKTRVIKAR